MNRNTTRTKGGRRIMNLVAMVDWNWKLSCLNEKDKGREGWREKEREAGPCVRNWRGVGRRGHFSAPVRWEKWVEEREGEGSDPVSLLWLAYTCSRGKMLLWCVCVWRGTPALTWCWWRQLCISTCLRSLRFVLMQRYGYNSSLMCSFYLCTMFFCCYCISVRSC